MKFPTAPRVTKGSRRIRVEDGRDHTYDVACDRCGDDDPLTEKSRPSATQLQWLCSDCADADREMLSGRTAG